MQGKTRILANAEFMESHRSAPQISLVNTRSDQASDIPDTRDLVLRIGDAEPVAVRRKDAAVRLALPDQSIHNTGDVAFCGEAGTMLPEE